MSDSPVLTHVEGRIGHLTFNRPKALNAFDSALIAATNKAMAELVADERVLTIVVSGAGRAFSAGFDLKESAARQTTGAAAWRQVLETDFDFVLQFWDCPKPTIAAVQGYCLAGAFELMLACDMAVAGQSALFGEPEVRFGSGAVALLLPWVTGPKQAKELLLTGADRVTAARALEIGVINRVVPDGQELEAATALARDVAAAAPESVRLTKRAINRAYELAGLRDALKVGLETDIEIESAENPERSEFNRIRREEGLQAALAWRDGRFGG
ncbi:MAG: enoyl-CoA hydratase/isomerase family protein [Pseudomonadota bacterium]